MFDVVSRTFVNGAKAAAGGVSKIVGSIVKAPKAIVRKARDLRLGSSKPKLPPRSRGPSNTEAAAPPPNPDNDTNPNPKPKGPPGGSKPKKTKGIE